MTSPARAAIGRPVHPWVDPAAVIATLPVHPRAIAAGAHEAWKAAVREIAATVLILDRTAPTPLRAAVGVFGGDMDCRSAEFRQTVRAGVAVPDLIRFGWAVPAMGPVAARPNGTAAVLQNTLRGLDLLLGPGPSLRAAVTWATVFAPTTSEPDGWLDLDRLAALMRPWLTAGLVEDGWQFAAAGLSVTEARTTFASGDPGRDDLALMAALRGLSLPGI